LNFESRAIDVEVTGMNQPEIFDRRKAANQFRHILVRGLHRSSGLR